MEIIEIYPPLIDSQFFTPSQCAVQSIIEAAESTGMIYPPIFVIKDDDTMDSYILASEIGANQLKAAKMMAKKDSSFVISAIVVDSDFDQQAIALMTSLSISGVESQR